MKSKIIISIFYILFIFNSNLLSDEDNKTLKVGLLAPLSGPYKEIGNSLLYSLNLSLEEISDKNVFIIPRDSGYNDKDKKWVLKDPSHMWSVDYLFNRFPDATIVQIHRHPKEVIPSVCSLVMSAKMMSEPSTSPILLGHQQLEQWASVLEKTIEIRKKYSEKFI